MSLYNNKRSEVVQQLISPDQDAFKQTLKPKVPNNRRRRKIGQPNRLNRRVDRMLKKLWPNDNRVPQIEDSLKDIAIRES